ncbi:MAG: hypothetical protein DWQ29_24310 [Planctomycetota bacterium]|nr:MAG: hypothetical protein DWQ29_24310 [Planctomycetota bacterium]
MTLQHVNVKLFFEGEPGVDLRRFIDLFHEWIVREALDELLIDVADYRHVPDGPAVLLVGHEADYAIDRTNGEIGLLYNRKAPLEGSNTDRFLQALRAAARACLMLESEVEGVRFSRSRFELLINDRALAPNTPESRAGFEAELTTFLRDVLGAGEFDLKGPDDARRRVGAVAELKSALDLERLPETA